MTHSRPARILFERCSHSVNVLWGTNCFNTTTFLLNSWAGLFRVVYPRLYGMSWRHFTVSMNPEFPAKFTLGGNVAIVVLIKWFYSESALCTSPWLHFKLNAIHSHTTWQHHSPSPTHAKNRKMPLPNCPIHWQTLYSYSSYPSKYLHNNSNYNFSFMYFNGLMRPTGSWNIVIYLYNIIKSAVLVVIVKLLHNLLSWVKSNNYEITEIMCFSDLPSLDLRANVFSFNV